MKYKCMYLTVLVGIFMAMNSFAYDGTGIWNYSSHSPVITCQAPYPGFLLGDGEAGILQDGNGFLHITAGLLQGLAAIQDAGSGCLP